MPGPASAVSRTGVALSSPEEDLLRCSADVGEGDGIDGDAGLSWAGRGGGSSGGEEGDGGMDFDMGMGMNMASFAKEARSRKASGRAAEVRNAGSSSSSSSINSVQPHDADNVVSAASALVGRAERSRGHQAHDSRVGHGRRSFPSKNPATHRRLEQSSSSLPTPTSGTHASELGAPAAVVDRRTYHSSRQASLIELAPISSR